MCVCVCVCVLRGGVAVRGDPSDRRVRGDSEGWQLEEDERRRIQLSHLSVQVNVIKIDLFGGHT